ncbi:hypothetical protein CEP90_20200 [Salmonella enterica subsp. enterica serovar Typhimurium var. 5-]|nr:hypothetical protein CEP90_20200 [Salmonella enterica subsp. enterica serovar Typhimurium var. 5-]
MSIKNDGHYFCRAGGNRPDGLNEPVTFRLQQLKILAFIHTIQKRHFFDDRMPIKKSRAFKVGL